MYHIRKKLTTCLTVYPSISVLTLDRPAVPLLESSIIDQRRRIAQLLEGTYTDQVRWKMTLRSGVRAGGEAGSDET